MNTEVRAARLGNPGITSIRTELWSVERRKKHTWRRSERQHCIYPLYALKQHMIERNRRTQHRIDRASASEKTYIESRWRPMLSFVLKVRLKIEKFRCNPLKRGGNFASKWQFAFPVGSAWQWIAELFSSQQKLRFALLALDHTAPVRVASGQVIGRLPVKP